MKLESNAFQIKFAFKPNHMFQGNLLILRDSAFKLQFNTDSLTTGIWALLEKVTLNLLINLVSTHAQNQKSLCHGWEQVAQAV